MSETKDSYIKIKKPYRNRARYCVLNRFDRSTGDGRTRIESIYEVLS